MHAALFAYVQNVPVIAYPQDSKIRYFFEDRGFPQCLYTSADNLSSGLEALLLSQPDYSQAIDSDKVSADELLCQINEIIQNPQHYEYSKNSRFYDIQFNKLQESYYLANMQTMMDISFRDTAILDLTLENQELKEGIKKPVVQTNFNSSSSFRLWLGSHFLFVSRYVIYLRNYRLILGSGLFDKNWYLAQYPDVAAKKVNPIWHYLFWGGFEDRDPGPKFSSSWYLSNYPDVTEKRMNPLVHYLRFGKAEGRRISNIN